MYRRWAAGEFGNRVAYWPSVQAFLDDWFYSRWPPNKPVALRYTDPGAPFCQYDIRPMHLAREAASMVDAGADPGKLVVNDSANPDDKLVIQGELSREPGGLHFRYTRVQKKMRLALAEDEHYAVGVAAKTILDSYVDPVSREWLDELLDRYPDHVIEFSTFSVPWGSLNLPTIIWEVRMY